MSSHSSFRAPEEGFALSRSEAEMSLSRRSSVVLCRITDVVGVSSGGVVVYSRSRASKRAHGRRLFADSGRGWSHVAGE